MSATNGVPAGPSPSHEDTLNDLQSVPLFMRELPKEDAGENDALEALRSLLYDGSPTAIAGNLKMEANDHFTQRNYKQASAFYTQAITECGHDIPNNLKRVLYANRAQCHLLLKNYGSCVRDCAEVLSVPFELGHEKDEQDPADAKVEYHKTTSKAYFRSAKALFALDKWKQCLDALERLALHSPPLDTAANQLLDQVKERLAQQEAYLHKKAQREQEQAQKDQTLVAELKRNHIILPPKWTPESAKTEAPPPFVPPHFSQEHPSQLVLPVFLLQPCAEPPTRDLIPEWLSSGISLNDQLQAFAESDSSFLAQYQPGHRVEAVDVYAVSSRGRMLKLGKKLDLLQVGQMASKTKDGSMDGMALVGGWALELYLVPKEGDHARKWIDEMKRDLKARGLVT